MNRDAMMVPLTYLIQFAGPIDSKTAEAIASALLDAGLHLEQCGIDYTHCTSKGDETLAPDMSELNREEIIKALECCVSSEGRDACVGCPFSEEDICDKDCNALAKSALALIKELAEKVEIYRNELGEVRIALAEANNDKKKLLEEIESLEKTNEYYSELEQGCYVTGVKNVKADTVRKMHSLIKERCIKGGIYPVFVRKTIDQIAKEMLEG